jgi:hypothetical protein
MKKILIISLVLLSLFVNKTQAATVHPEDFLSAGTLSGTNLFVLFQTPNWKTVTATAVQNYFGIYAGADGTRGLLLNNNTSANSYCSAGNYGLNFIGGVLSSCVNGVQYPVARNDSTENLIPNSIVTTQGATPDITGWRSGSGQGANYIFVEGPATGPATTWGLQWGITQPTNGQMLIAQTNATNLWTLGWSSPFVNPMTAVGDIIIGGTAGAPTKLVDVAVGSILISGGVGAAPSYSTAIPNGVTVTTQNANTNNTTPASTAYVDRPAVLAAGTTGTLSGPRQYFVCTDTCTITVSVPSAGVEYCVINDNGITTSITLSALGSSARYENSARTSYGTAGTGTLVVSAGVAGNKVCILGRDSTHYFTVSYSGTITVN